MAAASHLPPRTLAAPLVGWLLFGASSAVTHSLFPLALGAGLVACVLAAVHHAEVDADREAGTARELGRERHRHRFGRVGWLGAACHSGIGPVRIGLDGEIMDKQVVAA